MADVRMIEDDWNEALVETIRQADVLNTVAFHSTLGCYVAVHHLGPETEPFVFDLLTNFKVRAYEHEAITEQPKASLDGL